MPQDDAKEDEVFEIEDFTCASEWERSTSRVSRHGGWLSRVRQVFYEGQVLHVVRCFLEE